MVFTAEQLNLAAKAAYEQFSFDIRKLPEDDSAWEKRTAEHKERWARSTLAALGVMGFSQCRDGSIRKDVRRLGGLSSRDAG